MTLTKIMPRIEALSNEDKFKLMQWLISDLAKQHGISLKTQIPKKQNSQ